jgi:hypothetical protein
MDMARERPNLTLLDFGEALEKEFQVLRAVCTQAQRAARSKTEGGATLEDFCRLMKQYDIAGIHNYTLWNTTDLSNTVTDTFSFFNDCMSDVLLACVNCVNGENYGRRDILQ